MQNKGIIGTVCGDIIGSAYEFHKTKDMNFKLFTPRSKFTDDTVSQTHARAAGQNHAPLW